ncbi:effector-associated constant component EACC1 [Actinomadura opuntiae]|uniref:effector-associated constant component EACC1 n=1 Tax=Actinomadura sp. OS1-43 TaxID=604315 RepID=UPI00255A9BF2|nr:hypothetical protein [Actinomadura sp. OS1-43]MDL4816265.1 hypothetical protein [Actinomadura sp. OS1-43]
MTTADHEMGTMPGIAITEIQERHADAARTDEICRGLRRELSERGVPVMPLEAIPPPGAKSGAATSIGTIATVLASSSVTTAFVKGVFAWLGAREGRTVKITVEDRSLELSHPTREQEHRLIEWLTRAQNTGPEGRS